MFHQSSGKDLPMGIFIIATALIQTNRDLCEQVQEDPDADTDTALNKQKPSLLRQNRKNTQRFNWRKTQINSKNRTHTSQTESISK